MVVDNPYQRGNNTAIVRVNQSNIEEILWSVTLNKEISIHQIDIDLFWNNSIVFLYPTFNILHTQLNIVYMLQENGNIEKINRVDSSIWTKDSSLKIYNDTVILSYFTQSKFTLCLFKFIDVKYPSI